MRNVLDQPYESRETEETLYHEKLFMKRMQDVYNIKCVKMPANFSIDFFMTGHGLTNGKAVGEFKQRNMATIDQFDNQGGIFVNEKKITKMKHMKELYDISGYIFVGLLNGDYYKCKIDDIDFKHIKVGVHDNLYVGMNRGGEKDRQLLFSLPSNNFSNL